jgi:hypothetical protein
LTILLRIQNSTTWRAMRLVASGENGPLFARFAAMPDPDPLGSALSAFFKAWATVTVALALLLGALAVSRIAEDPAAIHHALHLSLIAMGD